MARRRARSAGLVRLVEAARAAAAAWRAPQPQPEPEPESPVALREAFGVTIDDDEDQWRRLSGHSERDLTPLTQQRMQELALYAWESNQLANRLVELPLAYILGEGVRLAADDEQAQAALDRFWTDPINAMDVHLVEHVRELALFGEQCWPTFVARDGGVRIGYLDPSLIETVVTDPENAKQPIGIVTKKDRKGEARRYKVVVNGDDEDLFAPRTVQIRSTFTSGECFYFRINGLSNGRRGRSDLLAQIDWLDAYDQFLFGELDRTQFLRAFVWDVTLRGATPEQVAERARKITAPSPGSVRVHNDSEEWKPNAPSLSSADMDQTSRLFRNHVLGGATMPEHWYGGGGDVNRSTGDSMGEPTFKVFSMRQRFLGYLLCEVGRYVVRHALGAGHPLDAGDPRLEGIRAEWPELTARDTSRYAAALAQVASAVTVLVDGGLLAQEDAMRMVASVASQLGVDIDPAAALERAREEAALRAEQDVFTEPPDESPDAAPGAGGAATDDGDGDSA